MTTRTALPPAAEILNNAGRLDRAAYHREVSDKFSAHLDEAERLSATGLASDARRSTWHIRQAEALHATANASVDFDQVLEASEPHHPDGHDRFGSEPPAARSERHRAADAHIEAAVRAGHLADGGAERVTEMMEQGDPVERDAATRWASATGDPAYVRAFTRLLQNPQQGHLEWTPEESRAFRAVQEVRGWLESAPTAAGYLVPLIFDPAVMLSNAGVISPIRDVARVVSVTTDKWTGISSAGTTAEWVAEGVQVAEMTPTIAAPTVDIFKLSVFVRLSRELEGDGNSVVENLRTIMTDAAVLETEDKYCHGNGIGQPEGLVTGLSGVPASVVSVAVAETLAAVDVYSLQQDLGPRFQNGASFLANLTALNGLAQIETTNGSLVFPELNQNRLIRRDVHEHSSLDYFDPSATATTYPLLYGLWNRAFVVADRVGASIEIIPHLMGANQRPTYERGCWLIMRTGSGVVLPEAGRALELVCTA